MNADRDRILAAIRRQQLTPQPRLTDEVNWTQYPSPREHFFDVLRSVGGEPHWVPDVDHLAREIAGLSVYQEAQQRCCTLPLVSGQAESLQLHWHLELDAVDDPHKLEAVDLGVLPGLFAVAENAAIWVSDKQTRQRAIYFITQHLILVVPASQIVSNMHQAYERLTFTDNAYGCFISGPSKTADIEQSLVIGAHGARSLHVFFVEDAASCGL